MRDLNWFKKRRAITQRGSTARSGAMYALLRVVVSFRYVFPVHKKCGSFPFCLDSRRHPAIMYALYARPRSGHKWPRPAERVALLAAITNNVSMYLHVWLIQALHDDAFACTLNALYSSIHAYYCPLLFSVKDNEAQLLQRDRATRYVSWNHLVNCRTAVRKILFEKTRSRWITLNVAQGHRHCR